MTMPRETVDPPALDGRKEERMSMDPAPYTLGSEEGEAFWFFGGLVTVKASAQQSGGGFALTE